MLLTTEQVAARLLAYCAKKVGCENADDLRTTLSERTNLTTAIQKMREDGCEFTTESVEDLVEAANEMTDKFDDYDGSESLFETVFDIIENA